MKTSDKGGCFIGTSWGLGAVPAYFLALGRELASRGMRVTLIVSKTGHPPPGSVGDVGVETWSSKRPTRLADAVFLAKLIRSHHPRYLIANFAAVNWMCLVGWLLRVKHRIVFYHTVRSQIEMDLQNTSPVTLKLLRLRKRFVYSLATRLVANSTAALKDLQLGYGVPGSKCAVQHLGIVDPCHRLPIVQVEAREDTVLCVGRLHPSKGQDILIDAIAGLGASANGTRFRFVGTGPALEDLRRRAAERGVAGRCVFEGTLTHEEVLCRMSQAKAVVVPSRSEAFGLVNVEAISVATPVVASCVGGISEIVRDGVEGLLFAPGDAVSLAERLATLLSDIELRKRLGSNGRERFLRAFELTQRVRDHATYLESLSG